MATSKQGFLLIELLIVMVIVTVLASISAPWLAAPTRSSLIAVLQELEELCLCAQYTALASNQQQCIVIDQAKKTCTLMSSKPRWTVTLPVDFTFGFLENTLGPPGDPRQKITQAVTFQVENNQQYIFFKQNGVISVGTLYIIDRYKTLLGALTCGVSQVSYIRKYLYLNNRWVLTPN